VEGVYALFVPDPKEYEEGTGYTESQSYEVDRGKAFVFPEVPQGDGEIVP